MEQNLSEKERKQRLGLGIIFGVAAIGVFLTTQSNIIVAVTGVISVGFIVNYFTCFCGTKRAIKVVKNKF